MRCRVPPPLNTGESATAASSDVEAAAGLEADLLPDPVPPGRVGRLTEANLDRHIWGLTLPAVAESLLQTALLLVDTKMVSHYGTVPVAASAISGTILWRAHMTFGCIERGTTAMVARYSGAGDHERVSRTLAQSLMLAALIGLALSLAGAALAESLLRWMRAAPDVVAAGTPYLRVVFLATIPRLVFFVASAALRGTGDSRTPMHISFWMNVLHIGLNAVLIYGLFGFPELKLLGSGISTALSLLFGAALIAWVCASGRARFCLRARHFVPHPPTMRTILRLAVPGFADEAITSVGYLAFSATIARLGTAVLAAHAITARTEAISFMAGFGFSVAAASLVGRSLGQGSTELARRTFSKSTHYCVAVMTGVALMLIFAGEGIMDLLFTPEESVASVAHMLILIAAVQQPLLAVVFTLTGGLRGAGDTLSPMAASFAGNLLVRLLVVYWLAFPMGLGIVGVYLGTCIDWVVRMGVLLWAYHGGRWRRVKV